MKRTYIILALIFLLLAAGLAFFPDRNKVKEADPVKIFASLNLPFRYVSTDNIASRIIKGDPALLLVDVRDEKSFNDFALKGAVNIPLDKITSEEFKSVLHQNGFDYVFYSNGDIQAENAWLICSRMGLKNLYIMKGGLNHWVETIFNPAEPPQSAPSEAWDTYDSRRAAQQYFLGNNEAPATETGKDNTSVKPKSLKPAKSAGGNKSEGC